MGMEGNQEDLTEKVTSEQRPRGGEGTIHMKIWRNHMPVQRNNEWKVLSWEHAWCVWRARDSSVLIAISFSHSLKSGSAPALIVS